MISRGFLAKPWSQSKRIYTALLVLLLGDIAVTLFHSSEDYLVMIYLLATHVMLAALMGWNLLYKPEEGKTVLEALVENVPCGVIAFSPDFAILNANREASQMTGVDLKMATGRKCYDVFGAGQACTDCPVGEAINTAKVCQSTLARELAGERRFIHHKAVPVPDECGKVKYVLGIGLDISKQTELLERNNHLFLETVTSLSNLIASRDRSTGMHSQRVQQIAFVMGQQMGLNQEELKELSVAAILHDIGKIGIPEDILNKTGKLSAAEYKTIQLHPQIGFEAIKNIAPLRTVADYVLSHHESYDGTGYPLGKAGKEIPLIARILAVADVFEAITADRVYRKAMSLSQAKSIMMEGRGTKFDPEVLDMFLALLNANQYSFLYDNEQHSEAG